MCGRNIVASTYKRSRRYTVEATAKNVDKMTRTAREMAEAQRDSFKALAENFASAQRRSMGLAEGGLKFVRLQEDNARAAQEFFAQGVRLLQLQGRSAEFVQSWTNDAVEVVREQAEHNARTTEAFARAIGSQQEGFRTLSRGWVGAYQDFFSPLAYARQGMKAFQQATRQGLEVTEQVTRQGLRVAEETTRQGLQATEEATKQGLRVGEEATEGTAAARGPGGAGGPTRRGLQATEEATKQGLRVVEEATERTEEVLRETEKATREAEKAAHEAELRTAVFGALKTTDYDALTVDEVSKRIDGLSADQLKQVREFEKGNKDRETLIAQIDRKIKAAS